MSNAKPYRPEIGARELTEKGRRIVDALDEANAQLSGITSTGIEPRLARIERVVDVLIEVVEELVLASPDTFEDENRPPLDWDDNVPSGGPL